MNRVIKFRDFEHTNETTYAVDSDGNMSIQSWAYYKDVYPEKYGEFNEMDIPFVWVIKRNDEKVAVYSSEVEEEKMQSMITFLRSEENTMDSDSDSDSDSIIPKRHIM